MLSPQPTTETRQTEDVIDTATRERDDLQRRLAEIDVYVDVHRRDS